MFFFGVTKVDVTIKATINDIEQIIIGISFFNSLASGAKIVSPLAVKLALSNCRSSHFL